MPDITPTAHRHHRSAGLYALAGQQGDRPGGLLDPQPTRCCHRYCACSWAASSDRRSHRAWRVRLGHRQATHVKELIDKVDRHRPDFIVYFDLSRSARNDYDAQWLWRELTERRGV